MRSALLFAAILLSGCNPRQNANEANPENVAAGRWTIIYSPHIQRSVMLIDTATGRTWNLVEVRTGQGPNMRYTWEPVERSEVELPFANSASEGRGAAQNSN